MSILETIETQPPAGGIFLSQIHEATPAARAVLESYAAEIAESKRQQAILAYELPDTDEAYQADAKLRLNYIGSYARSFSERREAVFKKLAGMYAEGFPEPVRKTQAKAAKDKLYFYYNKRPTDQVNSARRRKELMCFVGFMQIIGAGLPNWQPEDPKEFLDPAVEKAMAQREGLKAGAARESEVMGRIRQLSDRFAGWLVDDLISAGGTTVKINTSSYFAAQHPFDGTWHLGREAAEDGVAVLFCDAGFGQTGYDYRLDKPEDRIRLLSDCVSLHAEC